MKQFKLTLVLTVLMSMVGLQAFANWDRSTKVQVNGLYYHLDNDNLLALVTFKPSWTYYTGNIEIPTDFIYAGKIYSVTSIDGSAFYGCTDLTSITIPNSVTSIGNGAFQGCSGLTSMIVESGNTKYDSRDNCNAIIETASNTLVAGCKATIIPNSVTNIGNRAFERCSALTSIDIPYGVTSIGDRAFYESGLTSVTIPNSVTSIGNSAFSGCSILTSVTLNSNDIVSKAYSYSDNIQNIFGGQVKEYIIGDDVTSIGDNAFYGCTGITFFTIGNNVTSIGYMTFYGCTGLTTVNIPDKVTSIGAYAFRDCSGLESLTIGRGVTSYGNSAFQCSNLTSVTVSNFTPVAITQNVFTNRTNATLYVPNKDAYQAADYWKEFKEIVGAGYINIAFADANVKAICVAHWDTNSDGELSYDEAAAVNTISNYFANNTSITSFDEFAYFTGVSLIKDYAFNNCSKLTSVTIGNSVKYIENYAFSGCSGLTSFTIPNSVTSIGSSAFYKCSGLTSITIPNSVTSIGNFTFCYCTGLTSVIIPNSVTSISYDAFRNCTGLTSMIVESGNTKYDSRNNCNAIIETASNTLLYGCKNTTIPNSVTSIGNDAFYGCTDLTSITIPNSVTSIGGSAFCDCTNLTSVTIPNSVTSIGNRAFSGCSGLTAMKVESGNTKYDSRNNCNAIIETTSNTLVAGCKNTVIPNSVTSIGNGAFYGCSGLTSITIPNSVTSIGHSAFSDCSGLTSITIPNSVTSIGNGAFNYCSKLTSVTALNPTPVTINVYVFTNRTNATLYVPKGSKDAYKAADYWKEFKEIAEIEVTGIDQINFQEKGEQGIDEEGAVWYTIDGKQIDKPKKGINIIRMKNGTTKKVVVK